MHRREPPFARSYLTHVALGEGCNCAESVLRLRHGAWRAPESVRGVLAAVRERLRRPVEARPGHR